LRLILGRLSLMTLTGTISRRGARSMRVFFSLSFPFFFPFLSLACTVLHAQFHFHAPFFVLFFSHPEICARPGLAFLVWLVGGGVYGRHWQAA
jgi:hypothetical protein